MPHQRQEADSIERAREILKTIPLTRDRDGEFFEDSVVVFRWTCKKCGSEEIQIYHREGCMTIRCKSCGIIEEVDDLTLLFMQTEDGFEMRKFDAKAIFYKRSELEKT